jgi:hypothetical protein
LHLNVRPIGRVVTGERPRITQLLDEALTPTMEKQLARLLEADNGMYRISVFFSVLAAGEKLFPRSQGGIG